MLYKLVLSSVPNVGNDSCKHESAIVQVQDVS